VVIPVAIFVGVQCVRFHGRADQLGRLEPGATREEVVSRAGEPTFSFNIGTHTYWQYVPTIPEPVRLSFLLPDTFVLTFSPEGRLHSKNVLPSD
jgi:hypothetical protein